VKSNVRTFFGFAMLFLAMVTIPALGDTNQPAASEPDYSVELHQGKEIVLSQSAAQTLCSNVVELVKTSNFNSTQPGFDVPYFKEILTYRQTISTKSTYLVVSFKEPRNIKTVGGEINVQKIIIGLNPEYWHLYGGPTLFTKDNEARLAMHEKYDGPMCVELLKFLTKITGDNYFTINLH
jgi:hypothetical protein